MRAILRLLPLATGLLSIVSFAGAANLPSLAVGTGSGAPGATVTVPITFTATAGNLAALQCAVGVPSGWSIASVTAGPAATKASKSVDANKSQGMVMVFSANEQAIGTGVVAYVKINIPTSAASGTYPIPLSGVLFSSRQGSRLTGGTPVSGAITVASSSESVPGVAATGSVQDNSSR